MRNAGVFEGNLRENAVVRKTEAVVAEGVEGGGGNAAEVADAGKYYPYEQVEELFGALATQGDGGTDFVAFAKFERGDALAGDRGNRVLAGNFGQSLSRGVEMLGITDCATHTGTHHDLDEARNLVRIGVFELFFKSRYSNGIILFFESVHYFLPALGAFASLDLASSFLGFSVFSAFLALFSWFLLTLKMRSLVPSGLIS